MLRKAQHDIERGKEKSSRLAGAGGAAESALMNAQTYAELGERLCGKILRNHARSLQAKFGTIKSNSFLVNSLFNAGYPP